MPPPSTAAARLEEILSDGNLHQASDLTALGVTRPSIHRAVESGRAYQYARGLFCSPASVGSPGMGLAAISLRNPGVVACLLTAAQWHDLSDEDPAEAWIAIDRNRNRRPLAGLPHFPVQTVFWPADQLDAGIDVVRMAGADVRMTGKARTVVDLVRLRDKLGDEIAMKALHDYVRSGAPTKDLWDVAQALGALDKVEPFYRAAEEFSESIPVRRP